MEFPLPVLVYEWDLQTKPDTRLNVKPMYSNTEDIPAELIKISKLNKLLIKKLKSRYSII